MLITFVYHLYMYIILVPLFFSFLQVTSPNMLSLVITRYFSWLKVFRNPWHIRKVLGRTSGKVERLRMIFGHIVN